MSWELLPLRIPGGWAVHHNGLLVRREGDQIVEINDGEDLLWLRKLPPPDDDPYEEDGPWREVHIDVGWYTDHFRMVLLDPDWDHITDEFRTEDFGEMFTEIEAWLTRALPPRGSGSSA